MGHGDCGAMGVSERMTRPATIPASALGWPSTTARIHALEQQVADLKAMLAVERDRRVAPVAEVVPAVEWLPERPGVRRRAKICIACGQIDDGKHHVFKCFKADRHEWRDSTWPRRADR